MNIYDHIFTSAQAAKAADMTNANFRAQFSRKNWRIIGKERPGNGEAHLFTIFDVMAYALARRLMEYGFAPSRAFDLATMDFAHTGDEHRDPAGIYDTTTHGRTLFVASLDGAHGECVSENSISNPIELLCLKMARRQADAVLIDLTEMRERVFQSLGLDSRDYE